MELLQFFYIVISFTLLFFASYFLILIKKNCNKCFSLALPFFSGFIYFIIIPIVIISINNGYLTYEFYGINSAWASLNLEDVQFIIPFCLILITVSTTILFFYIKKKDVLALVCRDSILYNSEVEKNIYKLAIYTGLISFSKYFLVVYFNEGIKSTLSIGFHSRNEALSEKMGGLLPYVYKLYAANSSIFVAAVMVILFFSYVSYRKKLFIFSFSLLVIFFEVLFSGNRILLLIYIIIFSICSYVKNKKNFILILVILTPFLAFFSKLWGSLRSNIFEYESVFDTYLYFYKQEMSILKDIADITESGSVVVAINIVRDFGEKYDYLYGLSFAKIFMAIIPRSFYPDKLDNFTIIAARLYEPGIDGLSISTTMLGEMYANFGVLSIFFMPLISWWVVKYTMQIGLRVGILGTLALSANIVIMARMTFSDLLINLIFTIALIRFYEKFFNIK